MDNTTQDYSNPPTVTKKSKLPIIIIAVVLIVALSAGAILFSRNKSSKPPEVTGTITGAPTPSPTPTPTINKESVKIQVLNGTGTPGQAVKVAVTLKNAGYNLDNIKTGNVPDNLTTSSIASKAGFESIAADMKTVLSSDFPDIEISSSPLGTGSEFDIVITTGGKAYVAPTTPTPTGSATPTPTPTGTADTPTPTPATTDTPTPTPTP
ncbi:MAG: LytR C-terminal domain-containing protein [Candidatus Gottesmanbacteria bacterium]|nr:LytR C-terminal domain-containing protein [Candidatus Gottesmanbacteria bacterium]